MSDLLTELGRGGAPRSIVAGFRGWFTLVRFCAPAAEIVLRPLVVVIALLWWLLSMGVA